MQAFSHFLSHSRFLIHGWSHCGVNNIESEILKEEFDIHFFENSDSDPNSNSSLTDLYSKLAALHRQSNSRWAQGAHMMWLMNEDKNSKFFHYITRSRTHFNLITQVTNQDGIIVTNQHDIILAFRTFYSRLWTASSEYAPDIL